MAGNKPQRSSRSLAPIEQQVLSAFQELLAEIPSEPVMIRQLHEQLPGVQITMLSPILERLSRLGKLAVKKNGPRVEAIYSSTEVLGRVMAVQQKGILGGRAASSKLTIGITQRFTEPCEHAQEVITAYEKLASSFGEISTKLQEAERQNDGLVREVQKALNKQRKAEADRDAAQTTAEEARRRAAANVSEVHGLRRQIEELTKLAEQIPALQAKVRELEDRETVRGPLAERIMPFFA